MSIALDTINKEWAEYQRKRDRVYRDQLDLALRAINWEIGEKERLNREEISRTNKSIAYTQGEVNDAMNQVSNLKNTYSKMSLNAPEFVSSSGDALIKSALVNDEVNLDRLIKQRNQQEIYRDQLLEGLETITAQGNHILDNYQNYTGLNKLLQQHEFNDLLADLKDPSKFSPEVNALFEDDTAAKQFYREKFKIDVDNALEGQTIGLQDRIKSEIDPIYAYIQLALKVDEEKGITPEHVQQKWQYKDEDGVTQVPSLEELDALRSISTSFGAENFMSNLLRYDTKGNLRRILERSSVTMWNWENLLSGYNQIYQLDVEKDPENDPIRIFSKEIKDIFNEDEGDLNDAFKLFHKHSVGKPMHIIEKMWETIDDEHSGTLEELNELYNKANPSILSSIDLSGSIRKEADILNSTQMYLKNRHDALPIS